MPSKQETSNTQQTEEAVIYKQMIETSAELGLLITELKGQDISYQEIERISLVHQVLEQNSYKLTKKDFENMDAIFSCIPFLLSFVYVLLLDVTSGSNSPEHSETIGKIMTVVLGFSSSLFYYVKTNAYVGYEQGIKAYTAYLEAQSILKQYNSKKIQTD